MATPCILPYLGIHPNIGAGAVLAGTAAIIGRVVTGESLHLGPMAVMRADGYDIRIGSDCSFGARTSLHIVDSQLATVTGKHVSVGSFALVHACTVADDCVIGDEAVVMDDAKLGPGAVVAAGSFVSPRSDFDGGWLYAGTPAKPVRAVDPAELAALHQALRGGVSNPLVCSPDLPSSEKPRPSVTGGGIPVIDASSYVAPTATLEGKVQLEKDASIWFSAAVLANDASISIGERSNVQDNCLLETDSRRGPIMIDSDVTVGHNVRIGACVIGSDCLIGMGSSIGDGTQVEPGSCVAARALCEPGTRVESGYIWAGRPARKFRQIKPEELEAFRHGRKIYVGYAHAYLAELPS